MAGITNRGLYRILNGFFRAQSLPTNFYLALCTSATAPTETTNTLAELTQIASGNGYTTNGISVARNTTDFDTLNEVDASHLAQLQIKDEVWTAAGVFPASGNGARYAVLTDDNATPANRDVIAWWDLVSDRTLSDTQTLTLVNIEIDLTQ